MRIYTKMQEELKEQLKELKEADENITNILCKGRYKANVRKVLENLNDSW